MAVYFGVLTFVCLLALWSVFLPRPMHRLRPFMALAGYAVLCLFVGLRDHVGADWRSYNVIFAKINESPLLVSFLFVEPLYAVCNRVAHLMGGDIHLVNLICASILLACLYQFSRLAGIDSSLLLFISAPYLLFVVGMGYTRQSVAVGLGLVAIGHLRHDRRRMFYLFAGLATLFHYSAVFLVLLGWIDSKKRAAVVAALLAAASPVLFAVFTSPRYLHYVDNNAEMQSNGVWTRILLVLLGLALVFIQRDKWRREDRLREVMVRGAVALGLIVLLALFLSTLADRFCLYLLFIYILAMGRSIRNATLPFRYVSIGLVGCLTYAIFLVWFGFSGYAFAWYPYRMALYAAT